jgi:hypothetical protein
LIGVRCSGSEARQRSVLFALRFFELPLCSVSAQEHYENVVKTTFDLFQLQSQDFKSVPRRAFTTPALSSRTMSKRVDLWLQRYFPFLSAHAILRASQTPLFALG